MNTRTQPRTPLLHLRTPGRTPEHLTFGQNTTIAAQNQDATHNTTMVQNTTIAAKNTSYHPRTPLLQLRTTGRNPEHHYCSSVHLDAPQNALILGQNTRTQPETRSHWVRTPLLQLRTPLLHLRTPGRNPEHHYYSSITPERNPEHPHLGTEHLQSPLAHR
jgi:hypothetical protein